MIPIAALLPGLDRHPHACFFIVGTLVVIALGLALRSLWHKEPVAPRQLDWVWSWLIIAILVAGRWPSMVYTRELAGDESQMLVGAHTLTHDPVFWRSVNGGTAGPLDFFALWPAGWVCGWEGYLPARLTAVGLIALSLILAHQSMVFLLGRPVARLAGLTGLCVEALTNSFDFLHYSTELVPLTLIAGATYAAIRRWAGQGGPLWSGLGGLLLGAIPMSKWQVGPLAACMGVCWLWAELRGRDPRAFQYRTYLVAGALLPSTLFISQVLLAGEWQSFYHSYLLFNLYYTAQSTAHFWPTVSLMWTVAVDTDSLLPFWLPGSLIWIGLMVRFRADTNRTTRYLMAAGLACCAISLFSILVPRRPYVHYWQLLIIPVSYLIGVVMNNFLSAPNPRGRTADRWLVTGCAVAMVGLLLMHRAWRPNDFIGKLESFREHPRSELAAHVARYARPGEAIAIWGWAHDVYVEAGLRQATRDSNFHFLIMPGPSQEYFRERYLADLLQMQPILFVDSVGIGSVYFPDRQFAHENRYRELAAVIRANYILVDEVQEARIYLRRGARAP